MMYQAYRLDAFPWPARPDLSPQEFVQIAYDFIEANYQYAWSVKNSNGPIVTVFGIDTKEFILIGDIVWSPRASFHKRLKAGIALFDKLKDSAVIVAYCTLKDQPYFERLADYQILRRVGTLFTFEGERMAQFQTRTI